MWQLGQQSQINDNDTRIARKNINGEVVNINGEAVNIMAASSTMWSPVQGKPSSFHRGSPSRSSKALRLEKAFFKAKNEPCQAAYKIKKCTLLAFAWLQKRKKQLTR
jgi:hypothetical protein